MSNLQKKIKENGPELMEWDCINNSDMCNSVTRCDWIRVLPRIVQLHRNCMVCKICTTYEPHVTRHSSTMLTTVTGDAQSSVTPRPRYVTSHSLIGHKYWNITISQQLHGFSRFFLQIRIYLKHGIHKSNIL